MLSNVPEDTAKGLLPEVDQIQYFYALYPLAAHHDDLWWFHLANLEDMVEISIFDKCYEHPRQQWFMQYSTGAS